MAHRVSIGCYYSVDSPIHRLDPRVKLVAAAAFMISCFFVHSAATLALAAVAIGTVIVCARIPFAHLLQQIRPIALFLLVTSLINVFFVHTGQPLLRIGPLQIYTDGISFAFLYTIRFFLLLMTGSLLMLCTTATALTDAAQKLLSPLEHLGAPVSQVTLVLSIALRFVPILAQEADNIIAAQTARGANLEGRGAIAYVRACVPLVVPLFASALRHADNLARAMDARCYTGSTGRTSYHVMKCVPCRDGVFIALFALYLVALIAATAIG